MLERFFCLENQRRWPKLLPLGKMVEKHVGVPMHLNLILSCVIDTPQRPNVFQIWSQTFVNLCNYH